MPRRICKSATTSIGVARPSAIPWPSTRCWPILSTMPASGRLARSSSARAWTMPRSKSSSRWKTTAPACRRNRWKRCFKSASAWTSRSRDLAWVCRSCAIWRSFTAEKSTWNIRRRAVSRPPFGCPARADSDRAGRLIQPGARLCIVGQPGRKRRAYRLMIGVEPGSLGLGQHRRLDRVQIDRRHRDGLETEHLLFAAGNLARFPHYYQILDADAVFAGLVVAGLVRTDHAGLQGLRGAARRDALRSLMHRQIRADAVAGAVAVIEAGIPQ